MNALTIGVLAHVDAGKTTLTEALLFKSGAIKKKGRVDHQDAFLDTHDLEQKRGITILAKSATYQYQDKIITLLDTPGHVDFSPEAERAIIAMDYAILVISAASGLQSHTKTLWQLLKHYQVPVFLFINKTDLMAEKEDLLLDLQKELHANIVDFNEQASLDEHLAMTSEGLLNQYLEKGHLSVSDLREQIKKRELFPCYFGSALHLTGIDSFLEGLDTYTNPLPLVPDFGAYVYKISHDKTGQRLTHVKILSGSLAVKSSVSTAKGTEKINEIRLYNGSSYKTVTSATAGSLYVLTGLTKTSYGDTFGQVPSIPAPVLTPIMTYKVLPKDATPLAKVFEQLKYFEDEDPVLHVLYKEKLAELQIQVMGEVRLEILKANMLTKFQTDLKFSTGSVLYKETIAKEVVGYGHFEPLRHFAEVHLLLAPGKRGSGLTFSSALSEEELSVNYQNQVLHTLNSSELPGVLMGAPVTDLKITLIGGISHLKHTEGGDFLEATLRAFRQGLMKTTSLLLEPYVSFTIQLPKENLGRLLADLSTFEATFKPATIEEDIALVTGSAPAINLGNYPRELASYTKGNGQIALTPNGYKPAHNEAELLAQSSYLPTEDFDFPASSVFCAKGKSFTLSWDLVDAHLKQEKKADTKDPALPKKKEAVDLEADLKAIFERTYGKWEKRALPPEKKIHSQQDSVKKGKPPKKKEKKKYLLVDGYNIIFAWPYLKTLANTNLDAAREVLIDILSNYQGFVNPTLIVVFDAYKIKDHKEEIISYKGLNIVFTKEAETADAYIEKTVHEIGRTHDVTIATSDHLEQIIAYGQGGRILSANDFLLEITRVNKQIEEIITTS